MCRPCPEGSAVGTRIGNEQFGCREIAGTASRCGAGHPCAAHTRRQTGRVAGDGASLTPRWRAAGRSLTKRQ